MGIEEINFSSLSQLKFYNAFNKYNVLFHN